MDVNVREQRIPGVGRLYQLPLGDGWMVSVVVDARSGERELDITSPEHDRPDLKVHLSEAHAVTLAALLSGVRFVFESEPQHAPAGGVHVETVVIGAGSPAAGRTVDEIEVPDAEAARVLAVIRDDTPDLIEDDTTRVCQPGDRLVLAGRPVPLEELRSYLAG
jgi:K+/H+ antiporter YhaU regulatory subunit KhtT